MNTANLSCWTTLFKGHLHSRNTSFFPGKCPLIFVSMTSFQETLLFRRKRNISGSQAQTPAQPLCREHLPRYQECPHISVQRNRITWLLQFFFSGAPVISLPTPNLTVNESFKTQLSCKASGNPLPLIRWTLPNGSSVRNNGVLEFDNTSRSQHGNYACQASNKIGNSSVMIYLNVQCKYFIQIFIKIIN